MITHSAEKTPATTTKQDQARAYARSGDTDALLRIVESGTNPNLVDQKGQSLLMLASYNENYETTKMLLECGAAVDMRNLRGQTPLGGVAFKGNLEIVKLLVEAGADVNADNGMGLTPLTLARSFGRDDVAAYLEQEGSVRSVGTAIAAIPGHFMKAVRNAKRSKTT